MAGQLSWQMLMLPPLVSSNHSPQPNTLQITRCRRAHEITSESLYVLQQQAYDEYLTRTEDRIPLSFTVWRDKMSETCPQFLFWCRVMELQLLYLQLVKAFQTADFNSYVDSLTNVMPWVAALDLTNYNRWLPVHLHDMQELPIKHPDVYEKFVDGLFVVHKTQNRFSAMALDQAHEQENAVVKGNAGAAGLTENPGALRRWMVAGPEVNRIVTEFENTTLSSAVNNVNHHEQSYGYQTSFLKDILSVIDSFEELGNPRRKRSPCSRHKRRNEQRSCGDSKERSYNRPTAVQLVCRK